MYDPSAMLTNLKSCFIAVDLPSSKQCNSSLVYYLKVSPLHLPIFYISLSLYPASNTEFAPPDLNIWVSNLSIVIHFKYGQFKEEVENFNVAIVLSALMSFLFPSIQYADKYAFLYKPPPQCPHWAELFISIVFLVNTHSLPSIFLIIQFKSCSICQQNLFVQCIFLQLTQMAFSVLTKKHSIFQLELHRFLCFIYLFLMYIILLAVNIRM